MAEVTPGQRFKAGFWADNPIVVQVLGMCPTLAVSNSLENALVMGAAVTFVLLGANLISSLLRNLLRPHLRILIFTLTIAGFVTIADLFLQAHMPAASKKLGPFVPLIIVNCVIIARCEICGSKQSVLTAAADALGQGLGFALGLMSIATVREILGFGTWFGKWLGWRVIPATSETVWAPWIIMILPPGAFLTLGLLLGLFNVLTARRKEA